MKKATLFLSLFLIFTAGLFCKSVYDNADKKTSALLKEVDQLIEKGQFQSAFGKLASENNEYILAKRVEVAINGFAQSMMHQMFAFKNLEENETLYDVRTSDGSFSMIMFDPVKAIESFEEENGEKPILKYALAAYYQDVINRYGNQWLLTPEELHQKVMTNFQLAYDGGCYDAYSLSELATGYYQNNDLDSAIKYYDLKAKEFEFNATDNYHYAIIQWFKGNPKLGIKYADKAIEGYKDQPQYQCDSYIVAARISLQIPDYKGAEKYLAECKKHYPEEYRISQYSIPLYALQNDLKKTLAAAMQLYECGTANPATCQMIMEECNNCGKPDYAIEFFKEALKKYSKDDKACQNLYFHFAYEYYLMQESGEAAKMAAKAKEYFQKNGELTADIENMLKTMSGQGN